MRRFRWQVDRRGQSRISTQKGTLFTINVFLEGLRGNGPALAGKLGGGLAFALRAGFFVDRFQCLLRSDPAAACWVYGVGGG